MSDSIEDLKTAALAARRRYDVPSANATRAELRATKDVATLLESGRFYGLLAGTGLARPAQLAPVVFAFDGAKHGAGKVFARELRRALHKDVKEKDLATRAIAFRRLLACERGDELNHHLRRLLRRASQQSSSFAVDWGQLAVDLVTYGPKVRQRWAEQFYTTTKTSFADSTDITPEPQS